MATTDPQPRGAVLYDRAGFLEAIQAAEHHWAAVLADPDGLLRLVATQARTMVSADVAAIVLPADSDAGTLRIEAATGMDNELLQGRRFPRKGSISGAVMGDGSMVTVDELSLDRRDRTPWFHRLGPAVFVPLVAGDDILGVLVVARERGGRPFVAGDLELLGAFGPRGATAMRIWRTQEDLGQRALLRDRERIARDLHDTAIQRVFAASLSLQAAATLDDPHAQRQRIDLAIGDLDQAIRDMRSVIFALETRGPGLQAEVTRITRDAARALGFHPVVRWWGDVNLVAADIGAHLLATLREALSNVARHARATHVDVAVHVEESLLLRITDDGVGLESETSRGFGLGNMARRAEQLGGGLELTTPPGGGTVLVWRVPLASVPGQVHQLGA